MPEDTPAPLRHCPDCRKFVRGGKRCPYCGHALQGGGASGLASWIKHPQFATYALIGVCIVIFILEHLVQFRLGGKAQTGGSLLMGLMGVSGEVVAILGGNVHEMVSQYHQYWRLVTACFLHFSLIHILFNGMALRVLGTLAEQIYGKRRFWVLYFLCGVAGSAASLVWYAVLRGTPVNSAGASGAVFGILGLLFAVTRTHRGAINPQIRSAVNQWVMYGLLFGILVGADNAGHIGGLLAGAILGFLVTPPRFLRSSRLSDMFWTAATVVTILATLASFAAAGYFYSEVMADLATTGF